MNELVYPRERTLGTITLVIGLLIWLGLIVGTFGIALIALAVGIGVGVLVEGTGVLVDTGETGETGTKIDDGVGIGAFAVGAVGVTGVDSSEVGRTMSMSITITGSCGVTSAIAGACNFFHVCSPTLPSTVNPLAR